MLVFLPGKAEIEACARRAARAASTLVPLHGGLDLDEQRRAFERTPRRKVILATNVAETSLTIPGVGVVIDAGLVRQTRYHDGRGFARARCRSPTTAPRSAPAARVARRRASATGCGARRRASRRSRCPRSTASRSCRW